MPQRLRSQVQPEKSLTERSCAMPALTQDERSQEQTTRTPYARIRKAPTMLPPGRNSEAKKKPPDETCRAPTWTNRVGQYPIRTSRPPHERSYARKTTLQCEKCQGGKMRIPCVPIRIQTSTIRAVQSFGERTKRLHVRSQAPKSNCPFVHIQIVTEMILLDRSFEAKRRPPCM